MISCDLMSEYYKMCVAAGLNYYRKVPSVDDLFKLSGWSLSDWLHIYEYYTFAANKSHKFSMKINECIALKMIMKERWDMTWSNGKWIEETEDVIFLHEFLDENFLGGD